MAKVEEKSYRVHFWVISLLTILSTLWAVWDEVETRRPWKKYQMQFNQMEYAKVKADFDRAEAELVKKLSQANPLGVQVKSLNELEGQISKRMESLQKNPAYHTALEKLRELERGIREVEQDIQFAKSEAEEYFYRWKNALHSQQGYKKYQEQWSQAQAIISGKRPKHEALKKEGKVVKDQLKVMEAEIEKLRDTKEQITAYRNALKERLENIKRRPPLEIKQVVLPAFDKNRFGEPVARVDRCTTCHLGINQDGYEKAPKPFTTHPQRDILLEIHNPDKMGCTPCHRGQGNALRSALQAHGFTYEEENHNGHKIRERKYLEHWEEPMYEGDFIQSSCAICHQTFEITAAEVRNKGRLLFSELECHGCHLTEGYEEKDKIGPDLKRIKSKVYPGWLVKWINNPKQYLPKTRMPHYRFSDEEVLAIAAYLVKNSEAYQLPRAYQPGGSAERGKELVESVGCLGCHSIGEHVAGGYLAPLGYDLVPNLSQVAKKVDGEWLFNWLKDPKKFRPTTRMPNLRLSDDEARDITAYLLTLGEPEKDDALETKINDESLVKKGAKLIFDYGCYSCHDIKGYETATRIAPPLSDFGNKDPHIELYFGDAPIRDNFRLEFGKEAETWDNWTFNKLKDPRIYMDEVAEAKMPDFGLSDDNAKTLMVLLKSFTGLLAPEEYRRVLTETEARIEKGKNLVRTLNCVGCHEIYDKGGDIRKFYEDKELAPPILTGEGKKVQPVWLFKFLKEVTPIRPWLKVRMPTFDLSDEEAMSLVEYFVAMAGREPLLRYVQDKPMSEKDLKAAELLVSKDYLDCFGCHQQGEKKPEGPTENWAPDLFMARERLNPDWIIAWLRDPQLIQPDTTMPAFFMDESSGPDDILEGNEQRQMEVLRDYILNLGSRDLVAVKDSR